MDTYWLIDRMYGGTGGPNDEDYSKDVAMKNEDLCINERSVDTMLGEHNISYKMTNFHENCLIKAQNHSQVHHCNRDLVFLNVSAYCVI